MCGRDGVTCLPACKDACKDAGVAVAAQLRKLCTLHMLTYFTAKAWAPTSPTSQAQPLVPSISS